MAAGYTTPLLDFFRRGDVDRDVRLLASRGALAPRAHEQLALLLLLVSDADAEIARTAEATLQAIPEDTLSEFLARSDATEEMRTFFAARGIHPAAEASDSDEPLLDEAEKEAEQDEAEKDGGEAGSVVERLARLTVAQRVVRAMKGTREERTVLVRDPNKLVSAAVLSSPKLSDSEVESIARMANVSEEVLRTIGRTKAWMKNYAITVAVAKNPKTPVALSMNLLPRLLDKDVKMISIDRNVPDVLRTSARRRIVIDK